MPDHAALFRNAADALENPQDEHGLDLARLIDQLREAAKGATVTAASTATLATAESALQFVFDACARLNDSHACEKLHAAADTIRDDDEVHADGLESLAEDIAEELTDMQNNAGRALATIRGETAADDDENPFARDPATGERKVPLGMPAKES